MKRSVTIASALLLSAIFTGGAIAQSVNNTKDGWFPRAKYGLMDTYTWGGLPGDGGYNETIDSNQNCPTSLDALVNGFDPVKYAEDLSAFGFEYVEFSAWHCNMNLLYPSPVMDKWRGKGHAATRDLIRELINALTAKGIKLILYVHTSDGHDMSVADQQATGWSDTANPAKWARFQSEIFEEFCSRYGTGIAGFWHDGWWSHHNPNIDKWVDPAPIGAIIHKYNPAAVVISNGPPNAGCEYGSEEFPTDFSSDIRVATTWMNVNPLYVISSGWWSQQNHTTNVMRYTAESIVRYTIFQGGCSKAGGTVLACGSYWKGGWEGGIKPALTKAGAYLRLYGESLKNTYPSTSYILSNQAVYAAMPNGMVALRSPDNKYEYIHVLKPPAGATLDLPLPSDGKKFGSATMFVSGRSATLVQNATGVHITVPEAWDTLNTVIKLTVDPASVVTTVNLATNAAVTASSTVESFGWGTAKVVDGQQASVAGSMGWSSGDSLTANHTEWITVDLGKSSTIGMMNYYLRDNVGTGFPVDFTIQVSTDNTSWTTVVTKTGYAQPATSVQRFVINPTKARYVKITGTSLRPIPTDLNQYRMQFTEIEIYGSDKVALAPPAFSRSNTESDK